METGNHRVICGLTIGPNWGNLLVSVALLVIPAGVFLAFVAPDIGTDISWGFVALMIGLTVASLTSLFVTAFKDPGIIPRRPEPANIDSVHFPRSKEFKVNEYTITTKYCPTCNVQRPPRCSHCAVCNNCVEKFDHHCPWTGTCIGRRNYRAFLVFIWSTTALCVVVLSLCIARLVQHDLNTSGGFWESIKEEPAALALMVYVAVGTMFVGGLSGFHMVLICSNQTTYEHFRHRFSDGDNPYSAAPTANCTEALCARTGPYAYVYDPTDTQLSMPGRPAEHVARGGDMQEHGMEMGNMQGVAHARPGPHIGLVANISPAASDFDTGSAPNSPRDTV